MRAYGQKLVTFCTHTHAAKLVVEISQLRETYLNDAPKMYHRTTKQEQIQSQCAIQKTMLEQSAL